MKERGSHTGIPLAARIGLSICAAGIGLALTLIVVVAQAPNFDSSYKTGPLFADTGDVIAYTIVAANTGDQAVSNVALSDTLPVGTTFVTCTYVISGDYVPYHPCNLPNPLWVEDFDPGGRITTTLIVQVTGGTMQWPLRNCAYLLWDSSQKEMCFTTTLNPPRQYLPVIMRNFTPMPDLRVTSLTVVPSNPTAGQPVTVTVVVQNVGEAPAGPFWVDLYDNPVTPPTAANQIWNFLCPGSLEDCYGIAWYVSDGLGAGRSIVLTSLDHSGDRYSHWPGYFADAGNHDLYAFVDSWNWGVWYGAVLERNENLDNRYGPVSIAVAAGAGGGAGGLSEEEIHIPWRPNQP